MICPNCGKDSLGHQSDFTYEECGYIGSGIVSFYECNNCRASVEVCVPDDAEDEQDAQIRQKETGSIPEDLH